MNLAGVSVLLVDDDADTRAVLGEALSTCGATVVTAGSAREALRAVDETRFDVIVSDLVMPQHDGFDLIRALRTRRRYGTVPILALTVHAPLRTRALDAGFDEFLTNPVDLDVLCDTVARWASVRRLPRAIG